MQSTRWLSISVLVAACGIVALVVHRTREGQPPADPPSVSASTPTGPLLSRDDDDDVAALDGHCTTSDTPSLARSALEDSESTAGATERSSLRVRSSTGLAFHTVHVRDALGSWSERALASGRLSFSANELPIRVGAAGHRSVQVADFDAELVLEPDAQFTIEAKDLRSIAPDLRYTVNSIFVTDRRQAEDRLAERTDAERGGRIGRSEDSIAGFVSDGRWVAALNASRVERSADGSSSVRASDDAEHVGTLGASQLDVSLSLPDGRAMYVNYRPSHGARNTWRVDPIVAELRPLVVERVGALPSPETGVVTELFDVRPDREASKTTFAWGEVTVTPAESRYASRDWLASTTRFDFGALPLHQRFGVIVHTADHSAYGRTFFMHDGSVQEIELQPGLVLRGRLSIPGGAQPPEELTFKWGRKFEGEREPSLRSPTATIDWPPTGAFQLGGPSTIARDAQVSDALPPLVELEIHAEEFVPYKRVLDAKAARDVDCGIIELVPLPIDFLLEGSSSQPDPDRLSALSGVRFGTSSGSTWTCSARVDPAPETNALRVRLDRDIAGAPIAETRDRDAAPLGSPVSDDERIQWVCVESSELLAFERDATGRFLRVESSPVTIDVVVERAGNTDDFVLLSFDWRGESYDVRHDSQRDAREPIEAAIPRGTKELKWRLFRKNAEDEARAVVDAGAVAITGPSVRITIPR